LGFFLIVPEVGVGGNRIQFFDLQPFVVEVKVTSGVRRFYR
jgi:hypothetical protein